MNTTSWKIELSDGRTATVEAPTAEAARNRGYRFFPDATIVDVLPL